MPYERNTETDEALAREKKALRSRCVETYNIIENLPLDIHHITHDNVNEKTLCYIEGLRTEIDNSNTAITADENLLTSQFLSEIKEKTTHVQELTAYTKGAIHDVNTEINRLNTLIKTVQQAKSCPAVRKQNVQHEHLIKARERFQLLKSHLHGLLQSLFPNNSEVLTDVLGELMMAKMNDNSNGYIPVTSENYHIIRLLTDINIVSLNPYNNAEVKLAY